MASVVVTVRSDVSLITLLFSGWTGAMTLRVERQAEGERYVPVRSGLEFAMDVDDAGNPLGTGRLDDYEAPMDTPVLYRITQIDPVSTANPMVMGPYTLASGGWSWLKDPAMPWRNVRLDEVASMEVATFASRAGIFDVIDRARPVVVAARRQDRSTELVMTTKSEAQRTAMELILSSGQVLLLATPAGYGWGNDYVHVGDVAEHRLGMVSETSRRWNLPITVVDRPVALSYAPAQMTWGDVIADWATWSDVISDVATWEALIAEVPK